MEAFRGPYRESLQVASWFLPRKPGDGPPDKVEAVSFWFEYDGTEITDPDRIAELEAAHPLAEVS